MNLRRLLLQPNPRERPSAVDIIHYITSKETLAVSGVLPDENEFSTGPSYALASGHVKTRGLMSEVAEKFMKYINKSGTKGWVISATENIDTEPKHKYVRKLITKAWEKPEKIIKFYTALSEREIAQNTVVGLKACITLQHYLYHGPITTMQPQQNPELPLIILASLRAGWENICMIKEVSTSDYYRSDMLSKLIMQYADFLIHKVKFLITYSDTIDGSYAPLIQLNSSAKSPLQYEIIKSLLELWQISGSLHTLLLEPPKDLWNVRIGAALAVAQEEYGIISILSHTIKAFKSLDPEVVAREIHNSNATYFINSVIEEFSTSYNKSNKFFNTLRLIPELSERGDMIPTLPLGLDTYLRGYTPDIRISIHELQETFSSRNEIMGIRIPQCIRSTEIASHPVHELWKNVEEKESMFGNGKREEFYPRIQEDSKYESSSEESGPRVMLRGPNPEAKFMSGSSVSSYPFALQPPAMFNTNKDQPKVKSGNEDFRAENEAYSYFDYLPPSGSMNSRRPRNENQRIPPPPRMVPPIVPRVAFETHPAAPPSIRPSIVPQPEIRKEPEPEQTAKKYETKQVIEIVDLLGIDSSPRQIYKEPPASINVRPRVSVPPPLVPAAPAHAEETKRSAEPLNSVEQFLQGLPDAAPIKPDKPQNIIQSILAEESERSKAAFFIDMQEVKFQKLIGAGASAEVFKGVYRATDVAIKKLKQINLNADSNLIKEFKREITVLAALRHPNLVLFMGAGRLPEGHVCILTEFCSGGTLFKLLHESTHIPVSWKQRCKMALDIAKGMSFLHSYKPPFIHRDLKSLNLLLSEPVKGPTDYIHVKVTDFGLARYQNHDQYMTANAGTSHWMAPEICVNSTYTIKADVYSYGIVLWEIATRDVPYRNLPPPMVPYRVVYYNERPDLRVVPPDCPPQVLFYLVKRNSLKA
eukprot:TRINITY_DN64920_c1_g1_i1.p1 TRINITY_DN64920_c1_g1~~TRINITY_DN64920_c1_g1_i1.p1  ORF type:complete len:928 (-),score=42.57 TRINITY_DN64920_c1_g1_i1:2399-5182(-)